MKPYKIWDDQSHALAIEALEGVKPGLKWKVTIERQKDIRTLSQNAFSWMVYGVVADHTGHTADEIHEDFAERFAAPVYSTVLGREKVTHPTKGLHVDVMSKYIDRICAFAASDLGIVLPAREYD